MSHVAHKRHPWFGVGVALMLGSFALYPAYAFIAFLPFAIEVKIALAVAGWVLSWTLFAIGVTLGGRHGVQYVRRVLWKPRSITPPES